MEILTVAFFGHRLIENSFRIEKLLDEYIRDLITANEYVDFLVGRNGDFLQKSYVKCVFCIAYRVAVCYNKM